MTCHGELDTYLADSRHYGLDSHTYEDDRRMKPRFLPVLEMAISDGIKAGWNRAYKHTDTPSEQLVQQLIQDEIWTSLFDWFEMGKDDE